MYVVYIFTLCVCVFLVGYCPISMVVSFMKHFSYTEVLRGVSVTRRIQVGSPPIGNVSRNRSVEVDVVVTGTDNMGKE
jgi:hypothetical protein